MFPVGGEISFAEGGWPFGPKTPHSRSFSTRIRRRQPAILQALCFQFGWGVGEGEVFCAFILMFCSQETVLPCCDGLPGRNEKAAKGNWNNCRSETEAIITGKLLMTQRMPPQFAILSTGEWAFAKHQNESALLLQQRTKRNGSKAAFFRAGPENPKGKPQGRKLRPHRTSKPNKGRNPPPTKGFVKSLTPVLVYRHFPPFHRKSGTLPNLSRYFGYNI